MVLMFSGMGIVYLFLVVLIFTAKFASAFVSRFDHILPQEAPKKAAKPAMTEAEYNALREKAVVPV